MRIAVTGIAIAHHTDSEATLILSSSGSSRVPSLAAVVVYAVVVMETSTAKRTAKRSSNAQVPHSPPARATLKTGLSPNTIAIRCRCSRCRKQKIKCSGLQPCEGCKKRKVPCNFDDNETKVVVSRAYMRPPFPEPQPDATLGVLKEVFQISPGPATEKWSPRTQPPTIAAPSRRMCASRTVRISRRRWQCISPVCLSSRR